jgi:hypothetical protein
MRSRLARAGGSSEISFPLESVRRAPRKGNVKTFVIALLLVVSFLTFVATMLVHYPRKVDAFLNSDEPAESKHVVTTSNK